MDRSKLIDFLTEKIFEESADANAYIEYSAGCQDSSIRSILSKIAEEELVHQKMLVKALSEMAKSVGDITNGYK